MKLIFFFAIMATISCLQLHGQRQQLALTFTALDDGQYIPLDSILVENPVRGCDTVLYFPDTVLFLDMIVGYPITLQGSENRLILEQNYPNPFPGQTTFAVFIPEKQPLAVNVSDLSGREVAAGNYDLLQGWHTFRFEGGNPAGYVVKAHVGNASESIRMTPLPGMEKSVADLTYAGPVSNGAGSQKSSADNSFLYIAGDTLRYIGFAMTTGAFRGSDLIEDSPIQNQTYTFEISEGVPCTGVPYLEFEGQVYQTVIIGSQCWLKQSLDVGVMLNVDSNQTDNGIIEKYCYNNLPANCIVFGGLYQWDEMMQYSMSQGVQGICPSDWHLPTDAEWTTLALFLGGENIAGGHLKEAGTIHWYPPNTGADNSTGFTALPAGMYFDGKFDHIRANVEFWSSTYSYGAYSWYRILYNYNANLTRTNYFERWTSRSVRCIKD